MCKIKTLKIKALKIEGRYNNVISVITMLYMTSSVSSEWKKSKKKKTIKSLCIYGIWESESRHH